MTDGPVRGAVMPSAGFDPSAWALPLQGTAVALSQVAQLSAQRTLRLTDPGFTRLPRFPARAMAPSATARSRRPCRRWRRTCAPWPDRS
ncbi:hypothetical protein WJ977_05720 [Achromobacter xylosoxidans]